MLLFIMSCVVCYIFVIRSDTWLGDPLGEPILGSVPLLKSDHSQSVALIVNSYSEAGLTTLIGLFVAVGVSLRYNCTSSRLRSTTYALVLFLFGASSILSFFFVTRMKSAYLLQMQFDKINVFLLQPALNLHLLFLVASTLFALALVIMTFGAENGTQETL